MTTMTAVLEIPGADDAPDNTLSASAIYALKNAATICTARYVDAASGRFADGNFVLVAIRGKEWHGWIGKDTATPGRVPAPFSDAEQVLFDATPPYKPWTQVKVGPIYKERTPFFALILSLAAARKRLGDAPAGLFDTAVETGKVRLAVFDLETGAWWYSVRASRAGQIPWAPRLPVAV